MKFDLTLPNIPFYFMRHGETLWNSEGRYLGVSDIPLNDKGKIQATKAISPFESLKIKTICSSPLTRAKETAHIINEKLKASFVEINNLQECNWGVYEGQFKGERDFRHDWIKGIAVEGAETLENFLKRGIKGIQEALSYPSPVLIVSHGGVYGAILKAIEMPVPIITNIEYCQILMLEPPDYKNSSWRVTSPKEVK